MLSCQAMSFYHKPGGGTKVTLAQLSLVHHQQNRQLYSKPLNILLEKMYQLPFKEAAPC